MKGCVNMANSKFSYENQMTALIDFMQKEINELNSLPKEQAKKKARAGLIRVGILDINGQITKPYVVTKNHVQ